MVHFPRFTIQSGDACNQSLDYPINFSSQPFDFTAYGGVSSMQHNGSDGQGEADDDDDIEEKNRSHRLA
jgi:hypothetical protein